MKKNKIMPGINIQWPWSEMILLGKKTIETRSYPIPEKYIGVELALIETPGKFGKKEAGIDKARIIGVLIFGESFLYDTRQKWESDFENHRVAKNDRLFGYCEDKAKWGWPIDKVKQIKKPIQAPNPRGIVFASKCCITF